MKVYIFLKNIMIIMKTEELVGLWAVSFFRLNVCICDLHPQTVPGGCVQRQTPGAVGHQDGDTSPGDG